VSYLIGVGSLSHLEHVPGPPEQTLGNQFQSVCRCGHRGRAASNPSSAYKDVQAHADAVNAPSVSPAPAPAPASASSGPRTCGCGCGATVRSNFLPGHDAKLLSQIAAGVRDKTLTIAEALDRLSAMPSLKNKMESRMRAAGILS